MRAKVLFGLLLFVSSRLQVLLTSRIWRFRSRCNRHAAYVDQWNRWHPGRILTALVDMRLGPGNAHREVRKTREVPRSLEKSLVWPQNVHWTRSGKENLKNFLRLSRLGRSLSATLQAAIIIGLPEGQHPVEANSLPEAWAFANPIAFLRRFMLFAASFSASDSCWRIAIVCRRRNEASNIDWQRAQTCFVFSSACGCWGGQLGP